MQRQQLKRIAFLLPLVVLASLRLCWAGPFGFEYGMTKEQVLELVGKKALEETKGNTYQFSTAPKPHASFETYIVVISPRTGLIRIKAVSKTIETNIYGDDVKEEFENIFQAITTAYGKGEKYDFLRSGSVWNEPQDWMMGLLKAERSLAASWQLQGHESHMTGILLQAKGLSRDAGYITLDYEFEGFAEYMKEEEKKKQSVF